MHSTAFSISLDHLHDILSVLNLAVSQQEDMFGIALIDFLVQNLLKRFINFGSYHIGFHLVDAIHCLLLVMWVTHTLFEQALT